MFFLPGVARFLFVPMAEAVMAAMICSFILSRTLVPTMANYLLRKHAPHTDMHGLDGPLPRSRNPLVRFQRGFEAGFERVRLVYRELLEMALRRRIVFAAGFLGFVFASFALVPFLGRDFFPSVDAGQILMHARTQIGTRVEDTSRQFAEIQKAIRQIIPAEELATVVDNVGMPGSGINMTYNSTGTIGTQDGDIQIKLKENHKPTAGYSERFAKNCRCVSRSHVLLFAGRHHQPDSELWCTGADRSADTRTEPRRELRIRTAVVAPIATCSRPGRCTYSAVLE